MSAPDPEGMSLLTKALAAGTPIVGAVWAFFKLWDKKADKHTVNNQLQEVKNEQGLQRTNIGKIFDQMRDMEKVAEERHRELMMYIMGHPPK